MTQDVDLLSTRARWFAEALRLQLDEELHIDVRTQENREGLDFRIYQERREGSRSLVKLRSEEQLPQTNVIENVLVLAPVELMVSKVISFHSRHGKPKAGTDWRDLAFLLLRFPELKEKVEPALRASGVSEDVMATWNELASQEFELESDEGDLSY